MSEATAAKQLAQHWGKVGFEPIEACPSLVGQTTAVDALDDARAALADAGDVQITLPLHKLVAI